MPYIKQDELKDALDKGLDAFFGKVALPMSEGELNYAITQLVLGFLPDDPKYADYNSVVGVLESAKLEFYRRAVSPYENQKAFDNGDVYGDNLA